MDPDFEICERYLKPFADKLFEAVSELYMEIMPNSDLSIDDFRYCVNILVEKSIEAHTKRYCDHINGIRKDLGAPEMEFEL